MSAAINVSLGVFAVTVLSFAAALIGIIIFLVQL